MLLYSISTALPPTPYGGSYPPILHNYHLCLLSGAVEPQLLPLAVLPPIKHSTSIELHVMFLLTD